MSDASAEVSETESAKGKDKRRSARVASAAAAKAQPAKLQPTHSVGGESTSDRPPAAAKAASKKGKKADEPQPEPVQPMSLPVEHILVMIKQDTRWIILLLTPTPAGRDKGLLTSLAQPV